jgi:hypothetical protein
VQHIGWRIKGFCRVATLRHLWQMTPKDAQERLKNPAPPWCQTQGIPLPSASTIGRIICRAPEKCATVLHASTACTAACYAKPAADASAAHRLLRLADGCI